MFVIRNIFLTMFVCLLFLSCSKQEDENKTFDINNIVKSDELEFGYLDENNVFYPMPVFIYDSTISIAELYNMKYSEYGYPVTIKMTLKKIKYYNEEIENTIKNELFYNDWGNPSFECYRRGNIIIWFTDEKGNKISEIEGFAFYVKEETDSNYILTTRIVLNGEYVGKPIFFVDYKYFEKLDRINYNMLYNPPVINPIRMIPALQSGHFNLKRLIPKPDKIEYNDVSELFLNDTIQTVIDMRNSKIYSSKIR